MISGDDIRDMDDENVLQAKDPQSTEIMFDALKLIAEGSCDDTSVNPFMWSSTIAYIALGGRIKEGQFLDNVNDLVMKKDN